MPYLFLMVGILNHLDNLTNFLIEFLVTAMTLIRRYLASDLDIHNLPISNR